jgi:membrane-bound ClpP family serine protease
MMGALGADIVWPLVGSVGKALTELKPGGSAEFTDDTINDTRVVSVVSDSGYLPPGSDIVVTESRGSFIVVRKAKTA